MFTLAHGSSNIFVYHSGTLIDFETGVLEWMRPRLVAVKPGITDEEILEVGEGGIRFRSNFTRGNA